MSVLVCSTIDYRLPNIDIGCRRCFPSRFLVQELLILKPANFVKAREDVEHEPGDCGGPHNRRGDIRWTVALCPIRFSEGRAELLSKLEKLCEFSYTNRGQNASLAHMAHHSGAESIFSLLLRVCGASVGFGGSTSVICGHEWSWLEK
jgi:hypothetical protein